MMILLLFIAQLVFYEHPLQSWIYPIFAFALSFLLFFVAPAVVIDNSDTPTAIRRSVSMAIRNPLSVILWTFSGLFAISLLELIALLIVPSVSSILVMLINSLFILPYLIILQTQMYMEKYPLAR